jgi:Na+-translocating ferredoxin:NAD+ oxidoreductase RnfG subunit
MNGVRTAVFALVSLGLSQTVWAQTNAGIAGVVRDATGAVLPGVAVEAASSALIENATITEKATECGSRKRVGAIPRTIACCSRRQHSS